MCNSESINKNLTSAKIYKTSHKNGKQFQPKKFKKAYDNIYLRFRD